MLYEVIADGAAWVDSDGTSAWPETEAVALASHLKGMGYHTEVVAADQPA